MNSSYEVNHENSSYFINPDNKMMYGPKAMNMNDVCVCCGSLDEEGSWIDKPIYYIDFLKFILINFLFSFIGISFITAPICYYAMRKSVKVKYYLCPECSDDYKTRKKIHIISWLLFFASIVAVCFTGNKFVVISIFVFFILSLIMFQYSSYPVTIKNYKDENFYLGGISIDYFHEVKKIHKEKEAAEEPQQVTTEEPPQQQS